MILRKTPLKVYSNLKFLDRDYLHIGSTQIVKVAFKFLLYLTVFPFFEVSLVSVFILFYYFFFFGGGGQISIVFNTNLIQGFNGLACILQHFQEVNWLL